MAPSDSAPPSELVSAGLSWASPLPDDPSQVFTYLVSAPDFSHDSNRLTLRSEHIRVAHQGLKTGRIINGGAILSSDPSSASTAPTATDSAPSPAPGMTGSWLLIRATSLAEAKQLCMNDVYITGHAWDPEQLTIVPVKNII